MRKLFLICLVVCFSAAMINCGSGTLSSEQAKELLVKEINDILDPIKTQAKENLSEEEIKEAEAKIAKFMEGITVTGVRQEEKAFIAKVEVKAGKDTFPIELKFNKYDSGWQIDEVKGPDNQWVTKEKVVNTAKSNLAGALFAGKFNATMADMKSFAMAIESYITDYYEAPQVETLAELKEKLEPFYIKTLPMKDGWGNEFIYKHGTDDAKDTYFIGSGGSDGKFEGFEQTGTYTDRKGKDIIFTNGEFVYSPELK